MQPKLSGMTTFTRTLKINHHTRSEEASRAQPTALTPITMKCFQQLLIKSTLNPPTTCSSLHTGQKVPQRMDQLRYLGLKTSVCNPVLNFLTEQQFSWKAPHRGLVQQHLLTHQEKSNSLSFLSPQNRESTSPSPSYVLLTGTP